MFHSTDPRGSEKVGSVSQQTDSSKQRSVLNQTKDQLMLSILEAGGEIAGRQCRL